ncbi:MAG: hypothetical protein Q8S21_03655 [Candidatus Paracaedibacteraceae bacterium]|nr:hypothetical protein [Candidatus Paracaedibacteraceae bacterium]
MNTTIEYEQIISKDCAPEQTAPFETARITPTLEETTVTAPNFTTISCDIDFNFGPEEMIYKKEIYNTQTQSNIINEWPDDELTSNNTDNLKAGIKRIEFQLTEEYQEIKDIKKQRRNKENLTESNSFGINSSEQHINQLFQKTRKCEDLFEKLRAYENKLSALPQKRKAETQECHADLKKLSAHSQTTRK